MRAIASALVFFALAGVEGCGPSPAGRAPHMGGEGDMVVVLIVPEPDRLPFDPAGARLRAATAELGNVVGHPVTLVVDAALAAEWRSAFDAQLTDAIETVARDLVSLHERDAAAFAFAAPRLARIVCHYRALASRAEGDFDDAQSTLTITEPARGGSLVPRGLVRGILEETYERRAAERYLPMEPRDVPVSERRAYVDAIDGARATRGDAGPAGPKGAVAITKLVAMATLVGASDQELAATLRRKLLRHRSYFVQAYVHAPDVAQGPAPELHAAERAWVGWLVATLPTMTAEEKLDLARDVFVRGFNGRGYLPFAFPGFDAMGFALGVVDAWIAAGHPDTFASHTKEGELYEYVVCPHPKNANGDRSMGPRCDHHMYGLAVQYDAARKRLVDALVARKDALFTETAFAAIPHASGSSDSLARVLGLWRGVEADEATWTIGARVIAEENAANGGPRLVDEVRRVWAAYPARRGALLYVLAEADPYGNGAVDWAGFAHDYGAPLQARDLAAVLGIAPAAIAQVPVMWPAFGPGWSRSSVIVPHLDAWLDGPVRTRDPQKPYTTLRATFHLMCGEGVSGGADLAAVRAHLRERPRTHPGDPFVTLADEAVCSPRDARAARNPKRSDW